MSRSITTNAYEIASKKILRSFNFRPPAKNYRAGWEVLADEMTGYFGENCFWLFRRKEEWKIRDAYQNLSGETDQVVSVSYGNTEEYLDTIIGR